MRRPRRLERSEGVVAVTISVVRDYAWWFPGVGRGRVSSRRCSPRCWASSTSRCWRQTLNSFCFPAVVASHSCVDSATNHLEREEEKWVKTTFVLSALSSNETNFGEIDESKPNNLCSVPYESRFLPNLLSLLFSFSCTFLKCFFPSFDYTRSISGE